VNWVLHSMALGARLYGLHGNCMFVFIWNQCMHTLDSRWVLRSNLYPDNRFYSQVSPCSLHETPAAFNRSLGTSMARIYSSLNIKFRSRVAEEKD